MKRIIPLFLALCLLLGGCAVAEKPVEESVNSTKVSSLPTEESTFPTEETEETLTENSAYQVYGVEDPAANILTLAVLLNEPFETEPEATVVWNDGEYDRLYIVPRYVGSWVNVYCIIWEEEGSYSYTDKAVYSACAEDGCVIKAVLERPEGMPRWYVEVVSPTGEFAGMELTYNGQTGTPPMETIVYNRSAMYEPLKPVIYLYPQAETEVSVKLDLEGKLTCTYPAYQDGWKVIAQPDGTLTDEKGQTYNYLYWEAETTGSLDFSQGFCVKGEDTAAFLEQALEKLGLNRREANEFIVYWLPLMEDNPYNIIAFQQETYTETAKLEIVPAPDCLIRVFMAWYAAEEAVEIPPQELIAPVRTGFTVVEWGGSKVK